MIEEKSRGTEKEIMRETRDRERDDNSKSYHLIYMFYKFISRF